ncbi:MAG: hypothetical protein Q4B21_08015, partial [Bacteroidia bacterium]|nr:hypothetical protein [Bacteroidia bacterium]
MRNLTKRVISILCVLSMLFSMFITVQASGVKFTVGSVSVEKGTGSETVDVPIVLSGNTGLIGMTMTVNYAEGLTLTKVTKGDALSSLTLTRPGNLSANPVKATWDGEGENDYENGTIITFSFTVPKNVEKEYPIEISISGAIDENLAQVSKVIENGKITVGSQAHSHSFGEWEKISDNQHQRKCDCGETETESHNTDGVVAHKDATCTEDGVVGGTYCTR